MKHGLTFVAAVAVAVPVAVWARPHMNSLPGPPEKPGTAYTPDPQVAELQQQLGAETARGNELQTQLALVKHELSEQGKRFRSETDSFGVQLSSLTKQAAVLDARRVVVGRIRLHHETPKPNPKWTAVGDPKAKADGPTNLRKLRDWQAFPAGVFREPPGVVLGFSSLEAYPVARVRVELLDVKTDGFEYAVVVWHDSTILEADVSYIAVAK